jgi:Xaa-Pro aminopeptidase
MTRKNSKTDRRSLLQGVLGCSVGASLAVAGAAQGTPTAKPSRESARAAALPPDLSFLRSTPLLNDDRARFFMRAAGLDALVVSRPANVMYLTNHWPQLDRMGMTGSAIAIFPVDPARPVALVMHAFLYYYTHSPESDFADRLVFPYTQPLDPAAAAPLDGGEPPAAPARTMRVANPALLTATDRHRVKMLELAQPTSVDPSWALAKALRSLGLTSARLGIDDPELEALLRSRSIGGEIRAAENTLRRIRMSKSAAELRLMRLAAQNNVDAAMAAASRARELGSTRALRAEFFAETARRGNQGVFMVIGGTSTELLDAPIRDGQALSIDCVSTCRFYHGDFGRTIFVGEPNPAIRRAANAIATAWRDIQGQIRAGMRFADIPRIGRESLRKQGADLNVSFTPHSVGLFHTDHPQPSLLAPRVPEELLLEENMVLSVDCPVFDAGLGGTTHLEDLMLIRSDGAEPIHRVPDAIIVV